MTKEIEISIPVWNEEKRIEATLNALRMQSFKNFSVRIYDNCSDDRTIELARKFQRDLDLEIYVRTKNVGQNSNINRCFANCSSPYVALLSGNDIVAENYLEVLYRQLAVNRDAACSYAKFVVLDSDGRPSAGQPPWFSSVTEDDPVERACKSIAVYRAMSNFFALYRRSALDRVQPMPFRYGGDNVMACEIALYGKVIYADDTFMMCPPSPSVETATSRTRHLLRLFSIDSQRGVPNDARLRRFEHFTPAIDMYHGHLDMFRLADIPYEVRERLVREGTRAFFQCYRQQIDGDIQRIVPVLRRVAERPSSDDLLDQVLLFHALRKADECLLLVRSPELVEIRERLSRLCDAGGDMGAYVA